MRAIVVKNEMSDSAQKRLLDSDIPVLSLAELPLELHRGLMTIDRDVLEHAITEGKRHIFEKRQAEASNRLENLIEAYKHHRATGNQ